MPKLQTKLATQLRDNRAWSLHINGVPNIVIAEELGVTAPSVTAMIKRAAKNHVVNKLSTEEKVAVAEARWDMSEAEIRSEISRQLENGIRTVKRVTDPMGRVHVEETVEHKVDPALLRALSTHHDRRARQLNNQLSPDAGIQAVQVNVVKDFIQQGDNQGKLSADQWNQQAIDV